MKELQEKLDLLLTKYSVPVRATILDRETAKIDGIETPLLPHRAKRSNVELRKLVQGGTLEDVSVMRTGVVASKSEDLSSFWPANWIWPPLFWGKRSSPSPL